MSKHFLDRYTILDEEKPFDKKIELVLKKPKTTMKDRLIEKYVDSLMPLRNQKQYAEEILKYEKKPEKVVEVLSIPADRMLLGFKDLEYTKPFAPRINPIVSRDGALTHNGFIATWCAARGGGKSIAVSKFAQDGIQNRYRRKVPMITFETNPVREWHVHSQPITKLPQLANQKEKIEEHFKRWNDKKPRGYSSITYGFGFASGKEEIDRVFTLTLRDFFEMMDYNATFYKNMFMDLIGLNAEVSRISLSSALSRAKEIGLENITELKEDILKVAKRAKGSHDEEEQQKVEGRVVIPYINNALNDDKTLSDSKEPSLKYLFDDIDEYDNVLIRMRSQSSDMKTSIYSMFPLDKIIQERIIGVDSNKDVRKKSRLSIEKYPAGPIIILEEAKYVIPNTAKSYTKTYVEDQVNLGRKAGMPFCIITQFADLVDDKIIESSDYVFVSKVNTPGTREFLINKGIDRERIDTELSTLRMKVRGPFGLELSEYKMLDINNRMFGPFFWDLPLSMFKVAGT